jgi:hypothetical protein
MKISTFFGGGEWVGGCCLRYFSQAVLEFFLYLPNHPTLKNTMVRPFLYMVKICIY